MEFVIEQSDGLFASLSQKGGERYKDPRMLKRYANLRGSNLAKKLW